MLTQERDKHKVLSKKLLCAGALRFSFLQTTSLSGGSGQTAAVSSLTVRLSVTARGFTNTRASAHCRVCVCVCVCVCVQMCVLSVWASAEQPVWSCCRSLTADTLIWRNSRKQLRSYLCWIRSRSCCVSSPGSGALRPAESPGSSVSPWPAWRAQSGSCPGHSPNPAGKTPSMHRKQSQTNKRTAGGAERRSSGRSAAAGRLSGRCCERRVEEKKPGWEGGRAALWRAGLPSPEAETRTGSAPRSHKLISSKSVRNEKTLKSQALKASWEWRWQYSVQVFLSGSGKPGERSSRAAKEPGSHWEHIQLLMAPGALRGQGAVWIRNHSSTALCSLTIIKQHRMEILM